MGSGTRIDYPRRSNKRVSLEFHVGNPDIHPRKAGGNNGRKILLPPKMGIIMRI